MIKILHSSDWHLGKSLFAKSLLEDQRLALTELSQMIAEERPQVVILAGDLYDRSIPPEDAVKVLDRFLAQTVLEQKIPVAMIPGNHDSSTRVGVGADLLRASGLHVFSAPESIATPLRIENDGTKVSIYGIPYLEPAEWNFYFQSRTPPESQSSLQLLRTHAEALAAILSSLQPSLEQDRKQGYRTVLILHAYVTGGEASDSERPLSIGGSDLVPAELLIDFDYVALGHLHRPQKVLSERIRYPGSLFPYSQSEAGQNKGVMVTNLGPKREGDTLTFCEFKTTKRLRVLRGTLEDLLAQKGEKTDDYVIATLTDQTLPFEAFRRLHQIYPSLLHVARDIEWMRSYAEEADRSARALQRETSDRDVLAQFIASAASREISDEDREWLLTQLENFTKLENEAISHSDANKGAAL